MQAIILKIRAYVIGKLAALVMADVVAGGDLTADDKAAIDALLAAEQAKAAKAA